jgi:ATP-dependent Clp protease ATP-binding subunit ClpB
VISQSYLFWFVLDDPPLERDKLLRIKNLKSQIEDRLYDLTTAQREGQYEKASQLKFSTIPELERQLEEEQNPIPETEDGSQPAMTMLHDRVTSDDIARVVAKATGIPVTNLLKGEKEKLIHVSAFLTAPSSSSYGQS